MANVSIENLKKTYGVEQIGSPLELYDAPMNELVATFIGSPSINLLEGTILSGTIGGQEAQITQQERLNLRPGQKIPVSLRLSAARLFDASTGQRI